MLLIAGFTGADSISSTIISDGVTCVSSSILGQGQSYVANLFTTNFAFLMRDLIVNIARNVFCKKQAHENGEIEIQEPWNTR